ncbi:MAG: L,D-transpeptidase family protein [Chthoniobacterales bacterium]|nr:L,D-transpeptidase family protein [Chthoniobacterales bacterium]
MRILPLLVVLALGAAAASAMDMPNYHTKGVPTGKPSGPLKPGEYWWNPALSPTGPVVALVSIPLQTISVYRNGVLIGRSSVSTGAKGHSTPTGVFSILEKKREHYSRTYDDAPMPNMQRLTWNGVAMHSGNLPGFPASHGCIRMPYDFSKLLFSITAQGGTVIIGDDRSPQLRLAGNPGLLLAPRDFSREMVRPLAKGEYQWRPERSPSGPVTLVVSRADRTVYVYRNGEPIGRAPLEIRGTGRFGQQVFTLLEGTTGKPSWWAPGQPSRKWMRVSNARGPRPSPDKLGRMIRVNPEFPSKVYAVLHPGTTVLVTDDPMVRTKIRDLTIMTN